MEIPRICIIGAGFSGMAAGIQLQKQLDFTNFVIYEENEDIGGTWLVNTYPGCACDVPSHLYSYSFEKNPNWTAVYSPQPEIWRYLKDVAEKYDLYAKIKLNHKITNITWDDQINKWRVLVCNKIENVESELIFDVILSGIGGLRVPSIPEEFLAFKGTRIHSAQWDSTVQLEDKTVAVIGSGASAVQIIPAIARKVKKLIAYQRHPAWILPRVQFVFPNWLKWSFATVPGLKELYRYFLFWSNELFFTSFKQGSILQRFASKYGESYIKQEFHDNPELMEKVRPNYLLGCKRITPSNEYYPALKLPQVEVVRSKIVQVKDHSILTEDGNEEEIDVLICATGFKVQEYYAPLKIKIKLSGLDLLETWKERGPSAYMGICSSLAPNLFMLLGPNTALGHNSIIFSIECQLNYIIQILREMIQRKSKVVRVKESVEKVYMDKMLEDMKGTVWATDCGSWYADRRGVVTALLPYSLFTYWRMTRRLNVEDYQFD